MHFVVTEITLPHSSPPEQNFKFTGTHKIDTPWSPFGAKRKDIWIDFLTIYFNSSAFRSHNNARQGIYDN